MEKKSHYQTLREEYDTYYASFDTAEQQLLAKLNTLIETHPDDSVYQRKSRIHTLLCRECPVHLFRNTPLFFEISSGRPRHTWGGLQSPVGTFLMEETAGEWRTEYAAWIKENEEKTLVHGNPNPFNIDHHCAGYDMLLAIGINGIIERAEQYRKDCTDPKKQDFYHAVIESNRALLHLADRFAQEARRLASLADTLEEKEHYLGIADTASRVPAMPPRTFKEALCMILFYRECASSIEGIGISTFAQLDRMLYPYYCADLAEGRITSAEAKELFADLLIYTDSRFETSRVFRETSTTIELGGCDADGNIVYNELTDMILEAAIETRSINTKLNCRISKAHPDAYLEKIMSVQLAPLPCVMMHNDDVLIPARIRQGQDIRDARLYVGCGCHEVVLSNTEVCTRAETWISMPALLMETMRNHTDAISFEVFYDAFLTDAFAFYNTIVSLKNEGERRFARHISMPLYSSAVKGSLEKGLDITEGGAKYNSTMLSMMGTATLIDSIYAIKQLVFDEKRLSLSAFLQIIEADYEGNESLRQYILNKIPKHGTNDEQLNGFSAKVLNDLSHIAGQENGRGGKYLPAFYPHEINRSLGIRTKATPDGRHAYTPLSRGVSPSEFIETDSPLDIIHSLRSIDFTQYADSFITEITLPDLENNAQNLKVLTAIIRAFLDAGGSSLQFNLLNSAELIDAKKNPEQHRNLLVRVCGYSAAFVTLHETVQDEIIQRAIR